MSACLLLVSKILKMVGTGWAGRGRQELLVPRIAGY